MFYLDLEVFIENLERVGFKVRDAGLLEAALSRAKTSIFGVDAYVGLEMKAAAMTHSMVKNHALFDGNKRAAWFALNAFILMNGFTLLSSQDEAFDFILSVANDQIELDEMGRWITAHIQPALDSDIPSGAVA